MTEIPPSKQDRADQISASLARFFPEGKALLGAIEEALWRELGILGRNGGQLVFDDQYICTGGQLFELIATTGCWATCGRWRTQNLDIRVRRCAAIPMISARL